MEEERRRKGQLVYSSYILMVMDHTFVCADAFILEIDFFELINLFDIGTY